MKLKALLAMACVVLPMSAWAGGSAFINSKILLQSAPQAIAVSAELQTEFKIKEDALRKLYNGIKSKEDRYNKDSAIMSEAKRKSAEQEILAEKREFAISQKSMKGELQKRKADAVLKLRTMIAGVIDAYGKKKGYDFIFTEGVAYADDSVNITDEILAELKKK